MLFLKDRYKWVLVVRMFFFCIVLSYYLLVSEHTQHQPEKITLINNKSNVPLCQALENQ